MASWRRRKCCTKRELQSLAGHLNHACKVVRPGRRFLRGIFGLLSGFKRKDHFIRLNGAFRADLEWWHVYVSAWNGVSMMLRGLGVDGQECVEFWSDASGGWGCGAVWGLEWFQVSWEDYPAFASAPIAAKELLPILVAAAVWGARWRGSLVRCHCDNQAVVAVVKGGYCREQGMAHLLRCLFYLEAKFNFVLTSVHVPGVENSAADAVSRNKMDAFFVVVPQASRVPCPVPEGVVSTLVDRECWTYGDWMHWLGSMSEIR